MSEPLPSVADIYNMERYLHALLDNILKQKVDSSDAFGKESELA